MKNLLALGISLIAIPAGAATFYPIVSASSSTGGTDLWPASNLIQGPGVGYDAAEPHDQLGAGPDTRWVTDAPGGFPSDFIAVVGAPVITIDLGSDQLLGEMSLWGYTTGNSNGASAAMLRFATSVEGSGGFGTSITYNPSFVVDLNDIPRQSFTFSQNVTARFVELTLTDNYFVAPGNGAGGELPGGDRVGLGEVAFEVVPEPTGLMLAATAGAALLRRRRR